jgi:hypothetical protein
MSEWGITKPGGQVSFCPGCGRELNFDSALEPPELLKCVKCDAQWVLISGPKAKAAGQLRGKRADPAA